MFVEDKERKLIGEIIQKLPASIKE